MLILTRTPGETLHLGDDIVITVTGVRGDQIRLGIEAPKHVAVHRQEVYERIEGEVRSTGYSPVEFGDPGRAAGPPGAPQVQFKARRRLLSGARDPG